MKKQIRVLTGRHSGAVINLANGDTTIGCDAKSEIQISDWNAPAMLLTLDEQGSVAIGVSNDSEPQARLEDFEPRSFNDIVLCAGPADATWPSDISLLRMVCSPQAIQPATQQAASENLPDQAPPSLHPVKTVPIWARHATISWLVLASSLLAAVTATAMIVPGTNPLRSGVLPPPQASLERLKLAVAQLNQDDLTITEQDGVVNVSGIVKQEDAAARIYQAAHAFAAGHLKWNVRAADEVVRDLKESLRAPDVSVQYRGNGVFAVTGTVLHPEAIQKVVEQFRADLGPLVKQVDVNVMRADEIATAKDIGSALAVDGLQYFASSDGTKSFVSPQRASLRFQ
ncbi:type III secretion protein D [Collimonas sp. OK242]|jgi:type III secretion protein D|uniref:HrpD5 family protein n=1 Tax=Collimonas sp. OK242 TaxID=1798195 RepID=UPI00089C17D2|nr:HrpD5 family protein [Collimonas sp. OK242]SDX05203.1 type III secretion protein D [Collimonas sp. OK242]